MVYTELVTYRKKARALSEAETRQRIVDATVALHEELGPARTTVSAIADRAGVQRVTVYRHFPDEPSIIGACSAHWSAAHPPPDLAAFTSTGLRRARQILSALYAYYRGTASMLLRVLADAESMPVVDEHLAPFRDYLDGVASELERCWPRKSRRRTTTIQHVIQLSTWRSLAGLTSDDDAAAGLAFRWIDAS